MWPVIVLLAGPVLAGLLSLVIQRPRLLHAVNFTTMLALALAETFLTGQVLAEGSVTTLGALVYVDALSDFILIIITTIGLSCSLYMWSYMDEQVARGVIAPKHLGVFFDVLVAGLIAGIYTHRLQDAFDSVDTSELTVLKE